MNTHPHTYVESFAEVEDLIDASGVVDMVERWMSEDGEPPHPRIHGVLTAWLATALAGKPLDAANVTATLYGADATAAQEKEVLGATQQVLDRMDYNPTAEQSAPEERKRRRHLTFMNAILRAQHEFLQLDTDKHSVALGSVARNEGFISQAAEYQVATLVSSDLLRSDSVPNIVIGIAGHHEAAASELVTNLPRPIDHVMSDRSSFPTLSPELPLRTLVMEYPPHHEGIVLASADGAILVEGRWYRDSLPEALRAAMKDFRAATQENRSVDGTRVLDPDAQARLEEQRDALLEKRRAFEMPAPSPEADTHEQAYAYGSTEWAMAFSQGRYANAQFERTFRNADSALTSRASSLSGDAAHGFITTLIIAAANAQRIVEWKQYHSLDEGNGLLVDEWYAMYNLLIPRIQAGMAAWSRETQPHAETYWNIDNDEDTDGWRPDGSATVLEMTRATPELADTIAEALVSSLRTQAESFLDDADDLSQDARIELALDFIDVNRHGGEEGTWLAVPAGGALLAAEATLVWSEV